jgi:hypothetical protein
MGPYHATKFDVKRSPQFLFFQNEVLRKLVEIMARFTPEKFGSQHENTFSVIEMCILGETFSHNVTHPNTPYCQVWSKNFVAIFGFPKCAHAPFRKPRCEFP